MREKDAIETLKPC